MSKKLTPLEALWKIDHTICMNNCESGIKWNIDKPEDYPEGGYDEKDTDCKSFEDFAECYETIETALKYYEKQNDYYAKLLESVLNDTEHKALEIIKHFIKSLGLTFIFSNDTTIVVVDDDNYECWYKCKTQEEFDLLKGVLK